MSGLNSLFIPGLQLEEYLVSNQTGLPLTGGFIYFYVDTNRSQSKSVYTLVQGSGTPPTYSYVPLLNPIILSSVGTVLDANGNNVPIYYYPYDQYGNQELYYIEVWDAFGNLQFTREAWPFPYTKFGGGGGGGGSTATNVGMINQLTNSQFVDVTFTGSSLMIPYSGTGTTTVNIAPGWQLSFTYSNSGSITVTQTPVTGNAAYPGNPPYTLDVAAGSNITALSLIQTLSNNPDWAAPQTVGVSGYLSGSILLGPGTSVQMQYAPSNGNPAQTILDVANTGTLYTQYNNTIQLLPASSAQNGSVGYDNIVINLRNTSGNSSISNVQVIPLATNTSGIIYDQTPTNRQRDYMFHYWNPLLQAKPIPSYLVGWDFPQNPAQFLGHSVAAQATGANSSYYAWDQTILFQSANSGITTSQDTTGALKTLSAAGGGTQLALIQYVPAPQAIEMLSRRKCVHVSAKASVATTATVSLWYTKASLPSTIASNQSIVATLDANGFPATLHGTWTQVPRSGLSNATVTTSATNAAQFTIGTNATADFNEYGFSGWDMTGNTDINNATFFAIVVGTASLAQNAYVLWQSISCQDGDVPTVPAPKSIDTVLRECQYYYAKSFNHGVVPATQLGINAGVVVIQGTNVDLDGFITYPVSMYAVPTTVTFYNPINNNAQFYVVNTAADATATTLQYSFENGFFATANGGTTTGIHWAVGGYAADARLGQ